MDISTEKEKRGTEKRKRRHIYIFFSQECKELYYTPSYPDSLCQHLVPSVLPKRRYSPAITILRKYLVMDKLFRWTAEHRELWFINNFLN
jgi:hypothetical protein